MTFRQFLSYNHTEQTISSYIYAINRFKERCPNATTANYKDILTYLTKFNIKAAVDLAALKKYYDYLIEIQKRDDHPCNNIVINKPVYGVQFQDLFSLYELELLLNRETRYSHLHYRNKCVLSLLIYQGLSPANITNLRVRDIMLEDQSVYIRQTPKIRRRLMDLNDYQEIWLSEYLERERPKMNINDLDNLFLTSKGKPFTTESLNRLLRPMKPMYPKKNLTALVIRQSVIAHWINNQKMSLEQVHTLSGQRWLSTTEKYKRKEIDTQIEMINRFFPKIDQNLRLKV